MPNSTHEPAMREAECPYCERSVLVYQDPPRCPLCDCPLDGERTHPYAFPQPPVGPQVGPATGPEGETETETDA